MVLVLRDNGGLRSVYGKINVSGGKSEKKDARSDCVSDDSVVAFSLLCSR